MSKIAIELINCINKLQHSKVKLRPMDDLRSNEIKLLLYLRYADESKKTISDLSNCFDVTNSSITQQVNRLADLGYVKKETDENDRRSVFVSPTIKAAGIVMKIERNRQNNIEQLVAFLGEKDSKELIRLCERITEFNSAKQKQE